MKKNYWTGKEIFDYVINNKKVGSEGFWHEDLIYLFALLTTDYETSKVLKDYFPEWRSKEYSLEDVYQRSIYYEFDSLPVADGEYITEKYYACEFEPSDWFDSMIDRAKRYITADFFYSTDETLKKAFGYDSVRVEFEKLESDFTDYIVELTKRVLPKKEEDFKSTVDMIAYLIQQALSI